ncbi:MAG: hypothetical protein IJ188_07760 [Clostridia bacterium]|nr:hypothetical protein [Clostridia bacterium]
MILEKEIDAAESYFPEGTVHQGEYVYTSDGRLLKLERHDWQTVKANTETIAAAKVQRPIKALETLENQQSEFDNDCPEMTDEQIALYLERARHEKLVMS